MAWIHKQFAVAVPAAQVWAAFRNIDAIHTRLARDFVVDTRLDGDSRHVTLDDMLEQGCAAMKRTLEETASRA